VTNTSGGGGHGVIDAVAAIAEEHAPAGAGAEAAAFVRHYYERVADEDLEHARPADLCGAAMAHRRAGEVRPAGTAIVRICNPDVDADGWQSAHTVIDVVTDDMPFLVDSVTMVLAARHVGIHVVVHPTLTVERDGGGRLLGLGGERAEAWIHFEVDRQGPKDGRDTLASEIRHSLEEVRLVVDDWAAMRDRAEGLVAEVESGLPVADAEANDAAALLRWMAADEFTFLGFREYDLAVEDGHEVLRGRPGTGLGLLRDEHRPPSAQRLDHLPEPVREKVHEARLLVVTKANSRSTVHRADYFAYVGVKRLGPDGRVLGERRFIGLWGAATYRSTTAEIPLIGPKVAAVRHRAGLAPASHGGRELWNVLETYPRDDLFQISEDELLATALEILNLQERRQLRLFARRDDYGRFVSCLIYVPRERYSTTIVERMEEILLARFGGVSAEYDSSITASVLARLHVLVFVGEDAPTDVDTRDVERQLAAVTRWWLDDLRDALVESRGEEAGLAVFARYGDAFPAAYREAFTSPAAVKDLDRLDRLADDSEALVTALYQRFDGAADGELRLKLYSRQPISLSSVLPVLEQMGVQVVDERPYELRPSGATNAWIYDFGLLAPAGVPTEPRVRDEFLGTFGAVWRGELENDGFNRLVLAGGLTALQITVLRAYAKYLRQIGLTFSQSYVEETLAAHPGIARRLVELFTVRFDPRLDGNRALESDGIAAEVTEALDGVASLDQDRILRAVLGLVLATVRTNAYRPDGAGARRPVLVFKLDPALVPDLPLPHPRFEIWVYAPHVEGVHLRGGPVARGGIRWSDRREDFRTEVLGLMKAQMVKNAVIVPTGAKGGFVVKRPSADPEALRAEVVRCYTHFIGGLLDVTDDIRSGDVVPPPDVVRHDGDDPYLVVAADKGTATFSDIANDVARSYGYWLGDAFASGGSEGYDHKGMGITARGVWESVRRHFRNVGVDADTATITVVGLGDMSGDVFGNGMLLSRHLELVAAFDHRHVFLDPNPDPAVSWDERQRLFQLPRSSWDDYDRSKISAGGGVWPRSAKAVPLSDEVRSRLGTAAATLTPNELISAALAAPVDLLWNGGIGTYVKASTESHADVGDRTNDAVRIDATDLRATVVAEGGNLGLTQRARVEYALRGGFVNTDAIDNSAGVDTSDHEVNSKILLDGIVAAGDLTEKQRNDLLRAATDEVAGLVLEDNRAQNVALALARVQAAAMIDVHARYIRALEHEGRLSRRLEALPTDKQLEERQGAGAGLTTPELAVLLSYTKMDQVEAILASDLPDDPYALPALVSYFPDQYGERFADRMAQHRLRRQIIATVLVNEMVNRAGTSFEFRMAQETGALSPDTMRAHLVAREVLDLASQWDAVTGLGTAVPAEVQLGLLLDLRKMVERGSQWLLRHRRPPLAIEATVASFRPGVAALAEALPDVISPGFATATAAAIDAATAAGVPVELAARAAGWPYLHTAFDIVEVAEARGRTPEDAARVYWGLFELLDLGWFWDRVGLLPRGNRWQNHARAALRDDLLNELRALADDALRAGDVFTPVADVLQRWSATNERATARLTTVLGEIRSGGVFDLTTLSVALRQLRNLVQASGVVV
jgi:glutamate dehydrogenase